MDIEQKFPQSIDTCFRALSYIPIVSTLSIPLEILVRAIHRKALSFFSTADSFSFSQKNTNSSQYHTVKRSSLEYSEGSPFSRLIGVIPLIGNAILFFRDRARDSSRSHTEQEEVVDKYFGEKLIRIDYGMEIDLVDVEFEKHLRESLKRGESLLANPNLHTYGRRVHYFSDEMQEFFKADENIITQECITDLFTICPNLEVDIVILDASNNRRVCVPIPYIECQKSNALKNLIADCRNVIEHQSGRFILQLDWIVDRFSDKSLDDFFNLMSQKWEIPFLSWESLPLAMIAQTLDHEQLIIEFDEKIELFLLLQKRPIPLNSILFLCSRLSPFKKSAKIVQEQVRQYAIDIVSSFFWQNLNLKKIFRNNENLLFFAIEALSEEMRPRFFSHIFTQKIEDNEPIFLKMAKQWKFIYDLLPSEVKKDERFIRAAVLSNRIPYSELSDSLKEDKEVISCCIERGYIRYQDLSEKLQQDENFALACIEKQAINSSHLRYENLCEILKNKRSFLLQAFEKGLKLTQEFFESYKDQEDFLVSIYKLPHLSNLDRYDFNKDLKLYCEREVEEQLHINSLEMRTKKYEDLPGRFKQDKNCVLAAIPKDHSLLYQNIPSDLQDDREIIIQFLRRDPEIYSDLSSRWQEDKEIAQMFLELEGSSYSSLSDSLKERQDINEIALRCGKISYEDLPSDLQDDLGIILQAAIYDKQAYFRIPEKYRKSGRVKYAALSNALRLDDARMYKQLADEFKNDEQFIIACLNESPHPWISIPEEFRNDRNIVAFLVRASSHFYCSLPDTWKQDPQITAIYQRFHRRRVRE